MNVRAVLTKADLVRFIDEMTPFDVEISRRPRRLISLGKPTEVELVAKAGLRVQGDARIVWEMASLPVSLTVRRWRLLLRPVFVPREGQSLPALALDPVMEELDLKRTPGFLDDRVSEAVNEMLLAQRGKLVWDFGRSLGFERPMSDKIAPLKDFVLHPVHGNVEITASEVVLSFDFDAHAAPRARTRSMTSLRASR